MREMSCGVGGVLHDKRSGDHMMGDRNHVIGRADQVNVPGDDDTPGHLDEM